MSHKTLYIDVDEEITSIIDRVRKSSASEVIIVAPKQALLLQSLVNLKLLKKEADRREKKIIIVTQDKTGKKLIEKAGIAVQKKFDESAMEHKDQSGDVAQIGGTAPPSADILENIEDEEEAEIGSDRYFDEPAVLKKEESNRDNIGQISFPEKKETSAGQKKSVPEYEQSSKKNSDAKNESRVKMSDIVAGPKQKTRKSRKLSPKKTENETRTVLQTDGFYGESPLGEKTDETTDNFFKENRSVPPAKTRHEKNIIKTERVRGKTARYFFFFSVIFLGLAVLAGAYFFLPKATVVVHLKNQENSFAANMEARTDATAVSEEGNVIPANLEQIIAEKTGEFSASGSQSGGGKATGRIVIYNEYGPENQPLVATTRFETESRKVFRITKNVVVPGMTKVGGEIQPGAVETDIVADKPGADYNIDPASFKIPGFKGGPKYEKFYAKSSKAAEGGAKSDTLSITSQDMAEAKEKMTSDAEKEAIARLKESLGSERKYFSDTVAAEIVSAAPSAGVGTQTEKFSYTAKVRAKVLSFSEDDAKKAIGGRLKKEGASAEFVSFENPLNYLLVEAAKEGDFVKFEVKTDVSTAGEIDLENFKTGTLGKNSAALDELTKNYPSIQKAEVNFWPFFVNRIPLNREKVEIKLMRSS